MRASAAVVLTLLALFAIAGCGRRVVLDPSEANRMNDSAWKVSSTPDAGAR